MKTDRLRTLLSLSGVAVGIFSIAAALTLVDSLKRTLQEGFAAYGSDILYVEREPLEPDLNEDGIFRWWEYASRPPVTLREYRFLTAQESEIFSSSAFISYGPNTLGVEGDWHLLTQQPLAAGRGFTAEELAEGKPVAMVGAEAEAACGDRIWLDGARFEVIGIFEKAGLLTVCPVDIDHARLVPCRAQRGPILRGSILLSGADPEQIRSLMRMYRRLTPLQKDDFSLNRISYLLDEMSEVFTLAARLGWIIGFFSLLAGGIGIANMLYVSVEERRREIGISRAIGARRKTIERVFLKESLLLSLLGAVGGLALLSLLIGLLRLMPSVSLPLTLSIKTVLTGAGISMTLGILFGVAPARMAANLSPIEAMRD